MLLPQWFIDRPSPMLIEEACAKINLTLQITGRRADGYHLLESLVVFAATGDRLAIAPGEDMSLTLDGPFAPGLSGGEENLVLRAARLLAAKAEQSCGAALHLTKRLPVGAGIGGGSANAAAALRGLSRLWGIALPEEEMRTLALSLGADVPVCLDVAPQYMCGIGEKCVPLSPLPPFALVLVNYGEALPTAEVFARFHPDFDQPECVPSRWENLAALIDWLKGRRNALQDVAVALRPPIAEGLAVLAAQPGCLLARMSGSGATCFGLFETLAAAQAAGRAVGRQHPAWWVEAASVKGS